MGKIFGKIRELTKIKFVKDTVTLQLGNVTIMAVGFIATVIIARILNVNNYGVYALVLSIYGLVNFFDDFGIEKTAVIELAEAYTKKDRSQIENILAFYIKKSLLVSFIIFAVGLVLSPYLAHILYGKKVIGKLAIILFLTAPLGVFYGLMCAVFRGLRMMIYLTILENTARLCKTILIIIALMLGFGIPGIIISTVASSLICSIIGVLLYKTAALKIKEMPSLSRVLSRVGKVNIRPHFKFGLLMTADRSIYNLYGILPLVILGRFASHSEVGYFKLAKDLVGYFVYLFWPIYQNLSAKLPVALIREKAYNLKKIFTNISLVSGMFAVILAFILLLVMPFLIPYFYGEEYAPAKTTFYILLIYLIVAGFNVGLPALYQTLRQVKSAIYIKFLTLIFLLPLGIIFIGHGRAQGAAIFYDALILVSSVFTFIFVNRTFLTLGQDYTTKDL